MNRLNHENRAKIEAVKRYLSPYLAAKENCAALLSSGEITPYAREQIERSRSMMDKVERALGLLPVNRGKTILEKRFLAGNTWSQIYLDLSISQTTALTVYRDALLDLYDLMQERGIL